MSTSARRSGQAWYMDFAIALLLFTFTLVVYFSYTINFQKEEQGEINSMLSDAKAISSSLALSGYPNTWDNITVMRIGIADSQRLNVTKLKYFKQLNYSLTKKKFGTIYDYFVFFVDSSNNVLNLRGVCGVGSQNVLVTYNIKSAYYYKKPADSFLLGFMNQTFNADIYFKANTNDIYGLYGLMSNISKYGFVVMEQPLMQPSDYNNYKSALENFTSNGNYFMISGELTTAQGQPLAGATFFKKSGQSISDRNSTVVSADPYLSFSVGQSIVFAQAYYVQNLTATAFSPIATFNADGTNAAARWQFGNGTVYFFSDFDVAFFNGNFIGVIQDAAQSLIQGTCKPINVTSIPKQKLVRAERYLNYNSNVVKMVVYVWQ